MPVFTSIGLALGAGAATAFGVGVGATALAVGVGAAAYGAAGGFSGGQSGPSIDSRVSSATGGLSTQEAQTAAKKRAFRSGVLFTSPTGLDNEGKTSSAKLR